MTADHVYRNRYGDTIGVSGNAVDPEVAARLDWTELNVWEYIEREHIPTVSLYYNHGDGKRYRSLGCAPCTNPICSESRNVREIIEELRTGALSNIAERSGRAQDAEDGGGLETLRRGGYM